MKEITDYKLLLDTAVLAGQIMLCNGAEIYRVEDTIHRILKMSRFETAEAYVTPTGLIVTLDDPGVDSMTVVKRIDSRSINLNKITLTNEISRRFCSGEISLEEAFHGLRHMDARQYSPGLKYICNILTAAAFAVIIGGTVHDAVGAMLTGVCMVPITLLGRKLGINYFLQLLLSAAVVALTACLLCRNPFAYMELDKVVVGGIMPLFPGVALTTAVRDTFQGDYVAGSAKALEAFVRASGIAIGVWTGMMLAGGGAV